MRRLGFTELYPIGVMCRLKKGHGEIKDCVSLCVNATDSRKLEPLLVGHANAPHCFRQSPCSVPYVAQSNAWVDKSIYQHWWHDIFLPAIIAIRKYTTDF